MDEKARAKYLSHSGRYSLRVMRVSKAVSP